MRHKSGEGNRNKENQPGMQAFPSASHLLSPVSLFWVSRLLTPVSTFWNYLREASGENDYARYRAHALAREGSAMTEEEFYLWQLRRKYSQINRCC